MSVLSTPTYPMQDVAGMSFSQLGSANTFLSQRTALPLSGSRISSAFGTRDGSRPSSLHSPVSGTRLTHTPRSLSPAPVPVPGTGMDALSVWESPLTAPIPRARELSSLDSRYASAGLSRPMAPSTGSNFAPHHFGGYYERQVGDVGHYGSQPSTLPTTRQPQMYQSVWSQRHIASSRPPTPPPNGKADVQVSETIEALKIAGLRRLDSLETGLADIRSQLQVLCSRRMEQKDSPDRASFETLERVRTAGIAQPLEEQVAVQELVVAHDKLLTEHGKRQERLNRLEDQLQSLLPLEVQLPRARQELKEAEARERMAREEVAELTLVNKLATATIDPDFKQACTELAQMSTELDRHRAELERVRHELHDARSASESSAAEVRCGKERAEMLELEVQRLFPLEQQLKETTEELHRVTEESKNSQAELRATQEQLSSAETRWAALRQELANAQNELSIRAVARGEVLEDNALFAEPDHVRLHGDEDSPTISGSGELARAREELARAEEERDRIQQERAAAAAAFLAEVEYQDAIASGGRVVTNDAPNFSDIDETNGFTDAPEFDDSFRDKPTGFGDMDTLNGNIASNGFGDAATFDDVTNTATEFGNTDPFTSGQGDPFGNHDGVAFGDSTNFGGSNDIGMNGFGDVQSTAFSGQDTNAFGDGMDSQWGPWGTDDKPQESGFNATAPTESQWQPWGGDDTNASSWEGGFATHEKPNLRPSQGGYEKGLQSDSSSSASEDSITPSQSASRSGSPKQQPRQLTEEQPVLKSGTPQLSACNPYRAAMDSPHFEQARRPDDGMQEDCFKKKQQSPADYGAPSSPSSSHNQKSFSWAQGSKKPSHSSGSGQFPGGAVPNGTSRISKASSSAPDGGNRDLSWAQGKRRPVISERRISQFSFSAGSNESIGEAFSNSGRKDSRDTGGKRSSLQGGSGNIQRLQDNNGGFSPSNPFAEPVKAATNAQGGYSPLNPFATT